MKQALIGACNTANLPLNINHTDGTNAPLIYAAFSAKCYDDGHNLNHFTLQSALHNSTVMEPPLILRDESKALLALVKAGQKAAALDGRHLLVWGLIAASVLAVQYAAEVDDWLPSSLLWLWQPAALLGFVCSMFILRSGAGRRLGHPVSRAYTASFGLAGIALLVLMLAAGAGARPDAFTTTLLVTGILGSAFLMLGFLTPLRSMLLPASGWLGLLAFYLHQQAVVLADLLCLSLAFTLLLALPGGMIIAKEPK